MATNSTDDEMTQAWLRWFDGSGNWLLTPQEWGRQRADEAERRAAALLERLRQQEGIEIDLEEL